MATSSVSLTPRLRMTRHSPTHDRSAHTITTSISEAGPSRLPEFSQLVNITMKDMDISDNNIYASDVPTESNPKHRLKQQRSQKILLPYCVHSYRVCPTRMEVLHIILTMTRSITILPRENQTMMLRLRVPPPALLNRV
jgi:hypothetical protein